VRKYSTGDGKDLFALIERNDNLEFLKEHANEASEIVTREEAEINVRKREAEWISRTRIVMGI
jgi:hypothetical protein